MADLAVTTPQDTDLVSAFPAAERASRLATRNLLEGVMFGGGTTGGSANAQTLTVSNTGWTLTAGATVRFVAGFTVTSAAATLQVNSTTAKTLVTPSNTAIFATDRPGIRAALRYTAWYDGTSWVVESPSHYMEQGAYNLQYPVGIDLMFGTTVDPNTSLPLGITATWVQESSNNYMRITTSTPLTSGGSLSTSAESSHTHTVSGTTGGPSATTGVLGGGVSVASSAHTHDMTFTSGAGSSHSHTIEPSFVTFHLWRRTA